MRITAVHVRDFKRIHDIKITPPADRALLFIGGKNAQGKSSIIDALTAAFGGKRQQPADPVRHGAESAEVAVELDNGLTIKRVIDADGESSLEVRDSMGVVRSPQAVLDKLVSGRFLDPLAFLALPAKEQRAQLMKMIEGADRIAGLNENRARAFDKRTEVGRDKTKAQGELARLKAIKVEAGTPIDVAALTAEKAKFAELQREGDGLGNAKALRSQEATSAQLRVDKTKATIADLENKLRIERELLERDERELAAALKAEGEARCKLANAADAWAKSAARRAEIDEQIAKADAHNRAVFEADAHAKRLAEAAGTTDKLSKEYEELTKVIETIDGRKAEILGAAKLPVEGLSVDDEGITLAGVPFLQASAAERLRVALALAIAASPQLDDVWIRDGALCDEDTLAAIAKHAAEAKKRVWIERVGTADPGAIVIHDGKVAS